MKNSIINSINQHARVFPNKRCLQFEQESISYKELADLVQKTILLLKEKGIKENQHRVFLSGYNSVDLVVLFFSLMALEVEIVLVDPKSTEAEIDLLLAALPANFLLLGKEIFKKEIPVEEIIISYTIPYQLISTNCTYQSKRTAFVTFFSSGSTGEPKAFGFEEEKLMKLVLNLSDHLELNILDKVLCPVSITHSHGVMMSLPFILLGAEVYFLHPDNCQPRNILPYILQHKITVFTGVPFQYNLILEEPANGNELSSLRYAFCGSAPMSEFLAVKFEQKFNVRINQAYGISEIGPVCVNLFEEGNNNFQSAGKVIRNIDYKIVDELDEEVKKGQEGELLVRSGFMTEGYLNSEESLFRSGWMCTQDIVREDEYGNIFIVGRKSNFINIAGYKVYPIEVEKVLLSMKGVKDAIVLGEENALRTQTIKAFISTFYPMTEEVIKEHCRSYLSKYKIPHQIIFTEELPVNSIGKVIKRKIKE